MREQHDAATALRHREISMQGHRSRRDPHRLLPDRTLYMLFLDKSTRTRNAFETGMTQLGGHAIFLDADKTQVAHGESPKDRGIILSRYGDGLAIRHDLVPYEGNAWMREIAKWADIPVINLQCDIAAATGDPRREAAEGLIAYGIHARQPAAVFEHADAGFERLGVDDDFLVGLLLGLDELLDLGDDFLRGLLDGAEDALGFFLHLDGLELALLLGLDLLGRLEVRLAVIVAAGRLGLGVRVGVGVGREAGGEVLGAADFVLAALGEDAFIAAEFFRAEGGSGGEAGLQRGFVGLGVGIEAAGGAEAVAAAAVGETIAHGLVRPAMQVDVLEEARGDEGAVEAANGREHDELLALACVGHGDAADVETTALTAIALVGVNAWAQQLSAGMAITRMDISPCGPAASRVSVVKLNPPQCIVWLRVCSYFMRRFTPCSRVIPVMADLFSKSGSKPKPAAKAAAKAAPARGEYTAKDIEVLEGLEPVRRARRK
mgnify:CR=1 FL=1